MEREKFDKTQARTYRVLFTHQLVGNGQQYVEALDAVHIVLPLAINHHTWLLQHPWKEVVVVAIIHWVGRRRG